MRKLTIEHMYDLAKERGFQFLSQCYRGTSYKHEWLCVKCRHKWNAIPSSIKKGTGCPRCAGRCYDFSDIQRLAESRNFQLLSIKFIGIIGKYNWQCSDGHTWMATAHHVKSGTGCPYCNSYITEEACRFIFEQLTSNKFPKNRSVLGSRLELDGYCEELSLAFEYQGKQHYTFIKHLHKSKDNHEQQKTRDEIKKTLCIEKGIQLIEIPYHVNDLETFIRRKLDSLGIDSDSVNWKEFRGRRSMLEELQIAATKVNAECLSTIYINARTKMDFRCKKCDRIWESTSNDIKNRYGCLQCGGKMKKTIQDMKRLAQKRDLIFLSPNYVNAKTKHEWKCRDCQHRFMRTPSDIQQGKRCPKCSRSNGWKKRKEKCCVL